MINKTDSLQQLIDEHIKARRVSDKSQLEMSIQNQKLNQQNEDLIGEVSRIESIKESCSRWFDALHACPQIAHLKDEIDRLKMQINSLESNNTLISDMQDDVGHVRSQLEKLLVNITVVERKCFCLFNKVFHLQEKEAELTDLRKQNTMVDQQNQAQVNSQRLLETKLSKVIEKCQEMKQEYDLLKNNYE